jgi:fructose-1,6-bisphosphatase I
MAYLMVQAGGKATTGEIDILDILPEEIHQRVPVYMGSAEDVDDYLAFVAEQKKITQ